MGELFTASGWLCSCGAKNTLNAVFCHRCSSIAPGGQPRADPVQSSSGQACLYCGAPSAQDDAFCQGCGRKLIESLPPLPKSNRVTPSASWTCACGQTQGRSTSSCPTCGAGAFPPYLLRACPICQGDQIQKVSGIFRSGRFDSFHVGVGLGTGHTASGQTFHTTAVVPTIGSHTSELAKCLAPPAKSATKSWILALVVLVCLGEVAAVVSFLRFVVIATRLAGTVGPEVWWMVGFLVLVCLGPLYVVIQLLRPDPDENWRSRERQATWDRSYYCARCDQVFDPITGRHEAPDIWGNRLRNL